MELQNLKRLFWDVDEKSLSSLKEQAIIARTLSHGTLAQIEELFSVYGKEAVRSVFATLKVGALSPRRRSYFSLILS
ncbi:MAG: hypothetical protein E6Q53_02380 [Candidatus Moraniibacteriota bacterium]|jgi:hypothetical protein|nr:MAG: hypothetical protein E6Q53_02380 [Candidatus Moranbacteria bacterium]